MHPAWIYQWDHKYSLGNICDFAFSGIYKTQWFPWKSRNQTYLMIYDNFMIFTENDGFMEIQPDDCKKLQKHMKRHWFYKAWRIRAAPDQKNNNFAKNCRFSISQWISWICSGKCRFHRKSDSTTPRNPCATNHLLILFASRGHWCGLACQIH